MTRFGLLALALMCLALVTPGCQRCSGATPLAQLQSKQGRVERDFAEAMRQWKEAAVGATFAIGDAIQTLESATAVLQMDDGSSIRLEPDTLIRFSSEAPGQTHGIQVESGEAQLTASDSSLQVRTSVGLATIEAGGRLVLRKRDRGLQVEVRVGRATFEGIDGKTTRLDPGATVLIEVGSAVIEEPEAPSPAEPETPRTGEIRAVVDGTGASVKTDTGWNRLDPGARAIAHGSTLRLGAGTSVVVERGDQRARLQGAGTFVVGVGDGTFVSAQAGAVSLDSTGAVRVAVPGGVIVAAPGARASIRPLGKKGTEVSVTARTVDVTTEKGTETVHAGETSVVSPSGTIDVAGRGLDYADVEIAASESVVVHDPRPPTAVRFRFGGRCERGGVLQLVRRGKVTHFARGDDSAALPLGVGSTDYALRCLGESELSKEVAAQGTVTILSDAGTRAMPASAPASTVVADGRSYTVLYQNQPPSVSIVWKEAPTGQAYTLHHTFGGVTHRYSTSSSTYSFRSGRLREGRHQLYFEGGGKVSRKTSVNIRFDNAAPKATLNTPAAPTAKAGDALDVSGLALPGWAVEVGGRTLPQDGQGRFSVSAQMPTERRALAVRLTHPRRGTHIYLRRAAR